MKPTISLCMIVKDEEKNIALCLSSFRKWVDQIIILDTGSTDMTKDIAIKNGADIVADYSWNDDFSAARNRSLSMAECDMVMYADADDVIGMNCGKLLRSTIAENPGAALNISINNSGRGDVFSQVRIWPNFKGIRFRYPVHEQIVPSINEAGVKIVSAPQIRIFHTGYSCSEERVKLKHKRNFLICSKYINSPEQFPAVKYYMAAHYFDTGDMQRALRGFMDSADFLFCRPDHDVLWLASVIGAAKAALYLGDVPTGLRYCKMALNKDCHNPEAAFLMAQIIEDEQPEKAAQIYSYLIGLKSYPISIPVNIEWIRSKSADLLKRLKIQCTGESI